MSSTASDSDPDPAPTTTPIPTLIPTANSDIDVAAQPAVVVWRGSDGGDQSLPQLNLDLHYNARSNKAFFKLRTAVLLKAHPRPRKTNVFLFIHPERIRTLALDESPCPAEVKTLCPDAFCLRFDLKRAPALIVPKDSLAPRNQASGGMLDSLRALAQQTAFAVYSAIPCRTLPRRRLLSLCKAASRDGLRSIAAHSNITSLYAGNGGRIIEMDTLGISATATGNEHGTALELPAENPPAYDELPAGSQRPEPNPPKKRRRSSPEPSTGVDRKYIEDICAHIIDSRLADLRRDVTKQLQDLETRVMDHIDENLSAQRKDITEDIGDKIEDEYYGLKLDLQNYIREEMEDTEDRILDHISNASGVCRRLPNIAYPRRYPLARTGSHFDLLVTHALLDGDLEYFREELVVLDVHDLIKTPDLENVGLRDRAGIPGVQEPSRISTPPLRTQFHGQEQGVQPRHQTRVLCVRMKCEVGQLVRIRGGVMRGMPVGRKAAAVRLWRPPFFGLEGDPEKGRYEIYVHAGESRADLLGYTRTAHDRRWTGILLIEQAFFAEGSVVTEMMPIVCRVDDVGLTQDPFPPKSLTTSLAISLSARSVQSLALGTAADCGTSCGAVGTIVRKKGLSCPVREGERPGRTAPRYGPLERVKVEVLVAVKKRTIFALAAEHRATDREKARRRPAGQRNGMWNIVRTVSKDPGGEPCAAAAQYALHLIPEIAARIGVLEGVVSQSSGVASSPEAFGFGLLVPRPAIFLQPLTTPFFFLITSTVRQVDG
ncbi:hypothetical protein DL762_000423 [Monosporascus cannonballus]|uniref:Uncharacterized protein n=1 Tax=Monosporascus cannonballus TaxID=155416 RepID=A0ABY0HJQ9_9PEZI|nr:hypothetical protein DL762_000423 [Monosporascus cannonballus]